MVNTLGEQLNIYFYEDILKKYILPMMPDQRKMSFYWFILFTKKDLRFLKTIVRVNSSWDNSNKLFEKKILF